MNRQWYKTLLDAIRSIVKEEIACLEEGNKEAEQINELMLTNAKLNEEINKSREENALIKRELENLKMEQTALIEKYGEISKVIELYESLSETTKSQLSNMFVDKSTEGILATFAQWSCISGLWNYLQNKVIENDMEDMEPLKVLFEYGFRVYNKCFPEPVYKLVVPELGEEYNRETSVILGTAVCGNVKEVCLVGYKHIYSGKVNKALIRV